MQGPNGRLKLFVPVCEDRQLDSWLLPIFSFTFSPTSGKNKEALCLNELANQPRVKSGNENMILSQTEKS